MKAKRARFAKRHDLKLIPAFLNQLRSERGDQHIGVSLEARIKKLLDHPKDKRRRS